MNLFVWMLVQWTIKLSLSHIIIIIIFFLLGGGGGTDTLNITDLGSKIFVIASSYIWSHPYISSSIDSSFDQVLISINNSMTCSTWSDHEYVV